MVLAGGVPRSRRKQGDDRRKLLAEARRGVGCGRADGTFLQGRRIRAVVCAQALGTLVALCDLWVTETQEQPVCTIATLTATGACAVFFLSTGHLKLELLFLA